MGFRDWITENHPTIRVHKAGYYSKTLTNNKSDDYGWIIWPKPWRSDWDERVIALEPIHWREWTKKNWNENENKLRGSVSFEDCNWVKYPEIIIDDMRYLRRKGQILDKPSLGNRSRYWWREQQKCGIKLFPILKKHGFTEEEWKACCEYHPPTQTLSPVKIGPVMEDKSRSRSKVIRGQ
jgi:hypothetical protein